MDRLTPVNYARSREVYVPRMMWQPIASAPYYMELELAVIDEDGPLIFACERGLDGWINAGTGIQVDVHPTHWRPWTTSRDE